MSEEYVLVIPAETIDAIGTIDGFQRDTDRFLIPILSSDRLSYRPRSEMERDPSFKQLIPYILLQWTDADSGRSHLFTYARGKASGEARLRAKLSVGVGGHISRDDAADLSGNHAEAYAAGMQRELAEEVTIGSPYQDHREGLLYDSSNEVGRVHLGVVHRFELQRPEVQSNEPELADGRFVPVDELLENPEQLESWSRIAIEAIFGLRSEG